MNNFAEDPIRYLAISILAQASNDIDALIQLHDSKKAPPGVKQQELERFVSGGWFEDLIMIAGADFDTVKRSFIARLRLLQNK